MLALGLLVLAQALPATNDASNEAGELAPSRLCSAVQVTSPQIQGPQLPGPQLPAYSATQILDLRFRTFLKGLPDGPHVLELRVSTPKGHLYQVLTVPFTAPIPNVPAPMPRERKDLGASAFSEEAAKNETEAKAVIDEPARRPSVDTTFPVGGTAIVTSSLYGRWTVTPHLDGSLPPCGPARQFRIEQ
jgi:hypothetical protein